MEVACSPPESLGSQLMMIFGGLVVKNHAAVCSDRVIVRLEVEGGDISGSFTRAQSGGA